MASSSSIFQLVALISMLVPSDLSLLQVVTNKAGTCINQSGQIACWGHNENGELGRNNTEAFGDKASDLTLILYPINLGDDFVVKQLAGGSKYHFCAVSEDGRLKCWGWAADGE